MKGVATGIQEAPSDIASTRYQAYLTAGVERWREYREQLAPLQEEADPVRDDEQHRRSRRRRRLPAHQVPEPSSAATSCSSSTPTARARSPRRTWTARARRRREVDERREPDQRHRQRADAARRLGRAERDRGRRPAALHRQGQHPARADHRARPAADVPRPGQRLRRSAWTSSATRPSSSLSSSWKGKRTSRSRPSSSARTSSSSSPSAPIPTSWTRTSRCPRSAPSWRARRRWPRRSPRWTCAAMTCPTLPRKPGDAAAKTFRYEGYDIITLEKMIERDYTMPEAQTSQEVISYYAKRIAQDVKLPSQFAALVPKVREFLETRAFGEPVDLDEPAMIKAISTNVAQYVTVKTFVKALRAAGGRGTGAAAVERGAPPVRDAALSLLAPDHRGVQDRVQPGALRQRVRESVRPFPGGRARRGCLRQAARAVWLCHRVHRRHQQPALLRARLCRRGVGRRDIT